MIKVSSGCAFILFYAIMLWLAEKEENDENTGEKWIIQQKRKKNIEPPRRLTQATVAATIVVTADGVGNIVYFVLCIEKARFNSSAQGCAKFARGKNEPPQ